VKRSAVKRLIEHFALSVRRACRLAQVHRSTFRYEKKIHDDAEVRERIRFLARRYPRYSSPRIHVLLKREGYAVNHKKVERIYAEEKLSLRRKRKRRIRSEARERPDAATLPNERWSMDFMSDCIAGGRRFRVLTVIDEFTRESLAIEADTSISGLAVTCVLERVGLIRGFPQMILCDNGPEFVSKAMDQWCYEKGIKLCFITPGKPIENCVIESFNGRFRDECLNINWFASLYDARTKIEIWRREYNTARPHSSLKGLSPNEFRDAIAAKIVIFDK
jgi:putative transposase